MRTPVIARPCGSVPEVLRNGVTGFMASSIDELVQAVHGLSSISRQSCRAEFEARFSADVMAANYERIYYQLMDDRLARAPQDGGRPARGIAEEMVAGERSRRWRSDLETA